MTIGSVSDTRDHGTPFCQRRLHAQFIILAVKIVSVLRDNLALEVLPGPAPDAIARIDRRLAIGSLGTEISSPSFAASTCPVRQFLAVPVRSLDTAKISTLAEPSARNEKGHVRCLRSRLLRLCRQPGRAREQNC
jgi:hypothetical protein